MLDGLVVAAITIGTSSLATSAQPFHESLMFGTMAIMAWIMVRLRGIVSELALIRERLAINVKSDHLRAQAIEDVRVLLIEHIGLVDDEKRQVKTCLYDKCPLKQ